MLALLLSLAVAAPAVSENETYDRLFSEAPTAESIAAPEPVPTMPAWGIPLGLVALAGGLLLYKRLQVPGTPGKVPALRVVQRQALGDRNALILVEVVEPGGDTRRLLIGTGTGAPALLADLGLAEEAANTAMPEKAEKAEKAEPEKQPEMPRAEPKKPAFNVADEILAERSPARSREFSKMLARIGDE